MGDGKFKVQLEKCYYGLLVTDFTYIVASLDAVIEISCYSKKEKYKNKKQKLNILKNDVFTKRSMNLVHQLNMKKLIHCGEK